MILIITNFFKQTFFAKQAKKSAAEATLFRAQMSVSIILE